jgi:hypothetical protein
MDILADLYYLVNLVLQILDPRKMVHQQHLSSLA